MFPLSPLSGIMSSIILAGLVAAYSFGSSFVTTLKDQATQIAQLKREATMAESRKASMQRMIDRRDAAIAAAPIQCRDKIAYYIKHPDDIPEKFRPFEQLDAPNIRAERNASSSDLGDVFSKWFKGLF